MQNEAGSPPSGIVGANNPINVSEPGYGGVPIQDDGDGVTFLMSYPSVSEGVAAIAAYLERGNYMQIVADLQAGAGLERPEPGLGNLAVQRQRVQHHPRLLGRLPGHAAGLARPTRHHGSPCGASGGSCKTPGAEPRHPFRYLAVSARFRLPGAGGLDQIVTKGFARMAAGSRA